MFWKWLKGYLPRGLYGRGALILILPVVGLQLIVSVVFIQRHFEGVTRQMTGSVLVELRFLQTEAAAAPDAARAAAVAARLGTPLELATELPAPQAPREDDRSPFDLSGRIVIEEIHAGLPEVRAVDLRTNRLVRVALQTPHGAMEVAFDRRRVSASNPHQLLVYVIVMGVLLTLISYVFLRNQLRPIKRMAAAAEDYGKGRVVRYAPSGATEVRAAGRAFLDMRGRIERQTQTRTMMLSGVSHDLRTPLTRLRLGLSFLDEDEARPLIAEVDEMQRLVDGFLDFARGDAGDGTERVSPVALVAEIVGERAGQGDAVRLRDLPDDLPGDVDLRPMSVRRALTNLIDNGLRHGTRVEIGLSASERTLKIVVEDDGPGIPPELREEAQRPFARLDPARNQDGGGGVGLGLAIVADVARSHGGGLRLSDSAALGGLSAELVLAI